MIYFLVPAAHDILIKDYLAVYGAPVRPDFQVLHYEDLTGLKEFGRGTYVLAALDHLSPQLARLLLEIYRQLSANDGVRFLNHPQATLHRFELLIELNRLGRNEFRAVRASGDLTGLRFPVFLRHERLHEGALSTLLKSDREICQAIGRALIQGHKLRDLLLVEFCDTRDEAGFYRKYAAFTVGDRVIARSLNYGRSWMLKHTATEFSLPMVLEELDYVTKNPHKQQLAEIFKLAG